MTEILSVPETCVFLKISKPTLYRYISKGEIPALKVGGTWRFDKESLDQWVKAQTIEGTASRKKKFQVSVKKVNE